VVHIRVCVFDRGTIFICAHSVESGSFVVSILNLSKPFNYTTYLFSKKGKKRPCSEINDFMNGPSAAL
jgi:hypothetical protein